MPIFITSDSHFHHEGVLDFEYRPFSSVEEMNESLISSWNAVVGKKDHIYHLGDFSFGTLNQWKELLDRLNGNITLIKGNHDKSKITKVLARDGYLHGYHELGTIIKQEKLILHLSHYPMLLGARPRNFSIHGHLHSYESEYSNHVNVGIDGALTKQFNRPFGTPLTLDDVVQHVHTLNPVVEEERAAIRRAREIGD